MKDCWRSLVIFIVRVIWGCRWSRKIKSKRKFCWGIGLSSRKGRISRNPRSLGSNGRQAILRNGQSIWASGNHNLIKMIHSNLKYNFKKVTIRLCRSWMLLNLWIVILLNFRRRIWVKRKMILTKKHLRRLVSF